MDGNDLDFSSLAPIELPVKYAGRDYVLREASEADAAEWRNANARSARMQDGKVVGVDGIANSQALLVSRCLRDAATGKNVDVPTIRTWVSRAVKRIFDKAVEISDLREKPETEEELVKAISEAQEKLDLLRKGKAVEGNAGNSPGGTDTTSAPPTN